MIVLDACCMTDKKTRVFVVIKPLEYQNILITAIGRPFNQDCTLLSWSTTILMYYCITMLCSNGRILFGLFLCY